MTQTTIVAKRTRNAIHFYIDNIETGSSIATLVDGSAEFIFDPMADQSGFLGVTAPVANKKYFDSIGLTVDAARMIDRAAANL